MQTQLCINKGEDRNSKTVVLNYRVDPQKVLKSWKCQQIAHLSTKQNEQTL